MKLWRFTAAEKYVTLSCESTDIAYLGSLVNTLGQLKRREWTSDGVEYVDTEWKIDIELIDTNYTPAADKEEN